MPPDQPIAKANGADEADLAKAFQELARGERTATALENQLDSMEAKIDALLAEAEKEQQAVQRAKSQMVEPSANESEKEKHGASGGTNA